MATEDISQQILDRLDILDQNIARWHVMFSDVAQNLFEIQEQLEIVQQELVNVQPHIAQLSEKDRPFIDSHINLALQAIEKVLS